MIVLIPLNTVKHSFPPYVPLSLWKNAELQAKSARYTYVYICVTPLLFAAVTFLPAQLSVRDHGEDNSSVGEESRRNTDPNGQIHQQVK